MSWRNDILESIQAIAGTGKMGDKLDVYYAYVNTYDAKTCSCSCTLVSGNSDIDLSSVNLMSESNDGLLILPTKDSTVLIGKTVNTPPYVLMFSQIDKILYIAGGSTIQVDKDGLKLDGDKFYGLVKVKELTDKINALEKLLNDLITQYNGHTHLGSYPVTGGGGGTASGTSAATTSLETGTISPITSQSDIENKKVKHGDGS